MSTSGGAASAGDGLPLTLGFLSMADVPPWDIFDAAHAGGFAAASIRITPRRVGQRWFPVLGNPEAEPAIRAAAARTGVRLSNVSGYYVAPETERAHLADVVAATRRLGCDLIVQGCFEEDEARLLALLRDYAAMAADAGIRLAIEFMPFSTIKTLPDLVAIIDRLGRDNVGMVVDALHLSRSGGSPGQVARAARSTPVFLAQICDAAAAPPAGVDLFQEAITGRRLPGEGALPLREFLDALPKGVEIECEIPLGDATGLTPAARSMRIADATRPYCAARG
ncbi:MAG: sugar phosphate isomerase/epimerase [Rhizobiales bacterium]|nr:sugar phosphate isomerase/epimerase [Hyphomicrobiales bacterium]